MTQAEFKEMLGQTEDLPQLPEVATAMVQLTRELSVPVQQVAELLSADPALLERMLIVINSPFYRFTGSIDKIEDALSLVGYRRLCDLAVALSLLEVFPTEKTGGIDYAKHWECAVCQAVATSEVASRVREDIRQDAFSIGLIQDAGSLIFSRFFPMEYGQAIGLANGKEVHLVHAEREVLGFDHAWAASALYSHWGLPHEVVQIIEHHHFSEFDTPLPMDLRQAVHLANLANLISDVFYGSDPDRAREILYERAKTFIFHFGVAAIDELLEKIPGQLRETAGALSLAVGKVEEVQPATAASVHEFCPECGAPGSGKFCSECGSSLLLSPEKPSLSSDKILLAEDSAATRLALSILIKRLGYVPVEAINGADAIRLAKKERPGLILMDIQMPGMNGLEALRRIRKDRTVAHIPVVMLTSITSADTVIEALQTGANDYVVKPFTAGTIQDRVAKYMVSEP